MLTIIAPPPTVVPTPKKIAKQRRSHYVVGETSLYGSMGKPPKTWRIQYTTTLGNREVTPEVLLIKCVYTNPLGISFLRSDCF